MAYQRARSSINVIELSNSIEFHCTDPPDTVKSRLQMQGAGAGAAVYSGTADAFLKVGDLELAAYL